MKQQITDYKMGRIRNFGFGSILSAFFFERVSRLIPRVEIAPHRVRDPSQLHWPLSCRDWEGEEWPTPT